MSVETFFDNLYRAASKMISQFSTEEPLISDEAKELLEDNEAKAEIVDKIISKPTQGEVTITHKNGEVKFFVEA